MCCCPGASAAHCCPQLLLARLLPPTKQLQTAEGCPPAHLELQYGPAMEGS
jgi:hypothetical protein